MAAFLQGGDGDINSNCAVQPLDQDAVGWRDWTGARLGAEASRVAKAIMTEPARDATLDWSEDTLDLDWRWNAGMFPSLTLYPPQPPARGPRESKRVLRTQNPPDTGALLPD